MVNTPKYNVAFLIFGTLFRSAAPAMITSHLRPFPALAVSSGPEDTPASDRTDV